MAIGKENSKTIKISKAQQYMIYAVAGAGIIAGIAFAVVLHFISMMDFNKRIIMAKDEAIVYYSDTIKNVGVCKKPKGKVYSDEELNACKPNSTTIDMVPGTLRSNILNKLAANPALNSVQRDSDKNCLNPVTGLTFTYDELNEIYASAEGSEESVKATALIKSCSALRVIADALPAYKNEEALLASLDKIFIISGEEPESLSPTGEASLVDTTGLNTIMLNITADTSIDSVYNILSNIERSIRNFNIETASFEWNGGNVSFSAKAAAYYVNDSELIEIQNVIPFDTTTTKKKGSK